MQVDASRQRYHLDHNADEIAAGPAPGKASSSVLLTGPKEAAPHINAKGMNLEARATPNNHLPMLSISRANPSERAM